MVIFKAKCIKGKSLKVNISDIIIKDRIREDIGDLEKLKVSLKLNGLINPITITTDYELLAGFRRLKAAKELGWKKIECSMINASSEIEKLEIEAEENLTRKDFTPEEVVKIAKKKKYINSSPMEKFFIRIKKLYFMIMERIIQFFKKHFD